MTLALALYAALTTVWLIIATGGYSHLAAENRRLAAEQGKRVVGGAG